MTPSRSVRRLFLAPFALGLLGGLPGRAQEAAPPVAKTHTLFMGADIEIEQNKQFYRTQNVSGGSFVIKVSGRDVLVPMDRVPGTLKVFKELKLSEGSASVLELKGEPTYTPANDPQRKFVAAQLAAMNTMSDGEAAVKLGTNLAKVNSINGGAAPGADVAALRRDATDKVEANFSSASAGAHAMTNAISNLSGDLQGDMAKEMYDAMEITFRVSSPTPLSSPYVVIVAQYHEIDEKPGIAHKWIYAKELEAVDSQPRKVRIFQGGLPPGFQLEKFQLHLYNRGQELATNVAEKQVALTRDEAFEYVLLDYLSSHKGATVSTATPALGRPSPEARARLVNDQLRQIYYVKVNKDGLTEAAFLDESCSMAVADPVVESLIKDVRFKPALEKGKPVEGIARLKLGDLSL